MKKQIINFLIIGSINTIFYYAIYSALIYIDIDYKLSVLIATMIGVFFSFKTFGKYVFNNSDKMLLYKFFLVYIILYISNILLISIMQSKLHNYYISGLIATVCCAVLSFILNKWYVFNKKKEE